MITQLDFAVIFRVSIALSAFNLTHRWAKNNLHNQKRHIQEFLQVLICCFLIKQTETIVEGKKTGDHCKKHPEQNKINQQRCLIRELNPGHIISSRKERLNHGTMLLLPYMHFTVLNFQYFLFLTPESLPPTQ